MMMSVRRWVSILLAAPLLLAGAPRAVNADEPYEINVIASLTGLAAFAGKETVDALRIVEAEANKTGGISGRPIKFVVADDATNPQVTVQLMNGLIAKHVPLVLGSDLAALCNAQQALVKDGPTVYCLSPNIEPPVGSFLFSVGYSTADQFRVTYRYLRARGLRRIAIINSTDASGTASQKSLTAIAAEPANHDFTIVEDERFNPTDLSVSAQLARIKAASPQVLIAYVTGTSFGTVLHGISEAGLDIPVVTSAGNMSPAQMAGYRSFLPQELDIPAAPLVAPDQVPDRTTRQGILRANNAFKSAGYEPDQLYALGWDMGWLAVNALRKVGVAANATQLRDAINGSRGWAGALGTYDFPSVPQRGLSQSGLLMIRWSQSKAAFIAVSKPGGTPLRVDSKGP